jgi:hypothetical protein
MPLNRQITTDATEGRTPPVLHFKGTLADITDEVRPQRRDENKTSNWLVFDFNNLNVIESSEPFNFPTYRIEILELNIPNSQWEAMKKSIRDCGYSGPIDGLIGRNNIEMQWGTATLSLPKDGGGFENRDGSCWLFRSIEGVENTSGELLQWVIDHVDGKTEEQFKIEFTADATLRTKTNYAQTLSQVMNSSLLGGLVAAGSLTVGTDGIYHKAGSS